MENWLILVHPRASYYIYIQSGMDIVLWNHYFFTLHILVFNTSKHNKLFRYWYGEHGWWRVENIVFGGHYHNRSWRSNYWLVLRKIIVSKQKWFSYCNSSFCIKKNNLDSVWFFAFASVLHGKSKNFNRILNVFARCRRLRVRSCSRPRVSLFVSLFSVPFNQGILPNTLYSIIFFRVG